MSATRDQAGGAFTFRVLAGCALLVGLAFVQDPGFLVADTKFDLAAAPDDFLARALHLWDAEGAFGQLQNQAYGYLWPMGPLFLLGAALDVPGWAVQRLWQGLVLAVAFAGAAKMTRALGVRSDLACLLAGVAFALSARLVTTVGPISIEAWPSALAPWVLLPLVRGATTGSPRRAAALSALAVAMVGGVNAAATFAVIPLGAIWLLTRSPGPRRRALMLWWPLFTLLGTLWWLVPLFVMGAYSPPFLDYIETTSVTTFPTTLFDVLRGTSNWVPYVDPGSRAGNELLRSPYLVVLGGVVVLIGLVGLLDRRTPHRTFLVLGLVVGVLMVGAGHAGAVSGWGSETVRDLLDGALAPLRNVHKFDPVVRLPLVVGLAFVVDRSLARWSEVGVPRQERLNRAVLVGTALLAVVATALPVLQGRLQPAGATLAVPEYWQEAATWLDRESGAETALVVPGAPFGEYLWGSPKDEPLQWLASSRWAVRNVIPLTPPGTIRMLDGIESRFAEGRGGPGLAAALRRAGVRHLVVRNDLQRRSDVPDPVLVHQAIATTPGLRLAAGFGPTLGGDAFLEGEQGRFVVSGGWQSRYAAVEVYEVTGPLAPAVSAGTPATVVGGPEDLPDLLDLGVVGQEPVRLAADLADELEADIEELRPPRVVLTDGLRARERFFGRVHDGLSSVVGPGDVRRSGNPVRDYLVDKGDRWSTTARLDGGVAAIAASTSASDADAGASRRDRLPFAAVDGVRRTSWVPALGTSETAWWEMRFERPLAPRSVAVTAGADAQGVQTLTVTTAAGTTPEVRVSPGGTRDIPLPDGEPTTTLRISGSGAAVGQPLDLAEVEVAGVRPTRSLALPELPETWGAPDAVVLRADRDARTGCATIALDTRCTVGRDRRGEESVIARRSFTLPEGDRYSARMTAWPRTGRALGSLVLQDQLAAVSASSHSLEDPRASSLAAIDGDPGTTWLAALDDESPRLSVRWVDQRRVTGIRLAVLDEVAARAPVRVELSWLGGGTVVTLDERGRARLPAVRTDQLDITVLDADNTVDLDVAGAASTPPVGIGEVRLRGVPYLPVRPSTERRLHPCGSGPVVRVDGQRQRTAVVASPAALVRGEEATVVPCRGGPVSGGVLDLVAGEHELVVEAVPGFAPGSVVLEREGAAPPLVAPPSDADLLTNGPTRLTVTPGPGDEVVVVRQNFNPGWVAEQDGKRLVPVRVDGWQQGWLLPEDAGDGPVEAVFAPDRVYRAGLALGLLGLATLALLVLLLHRRRRQEHAEPAALHGRTLPWWGGPVLALVVAPLVAGGVGLALAVPVAALCLWLRRQPPEPAAWVLALPVAVAAAAYALTPWGSTSGWAGSEAWVGYLALVPLVGLLTLLGEVGPAGPRPGTRASLRRSAGRSTSR